MTQILLKHSKDKVLLKGKLGKAYFAEQLFMRFSSIMYHSTPSPFGVSIYCMHNAQQWVQCIHILYSRNSYQG